MDKWEKLYLKETGKMPLKYEDIFQWFNKKFNLVEDILEDLHDNMVLKPINELENYRKNLKKLFEIFGYDIKNLEDK